MWTSQFEFGGIKAVCNKFFCFGLSLVPLGAPAEQYFYYTYIYFIYLLYLYIPNAFLRNKQTKSLFKYNFLAVVNDGIAPPQRILFPPEKIRMDWQETQSVGVGLYNLGNTCFLNATLQCLTYTPPLANYMLSLEHSQSCEYFLTVF